MIDDYEIPRPYWHVYITFIGGSDEVIFCSYSFNEAQRILEEHIKKFKKLKKLNSFFKLNVLELKKSNMVGRPEQYYSKEIEVPVDKILYFEIGEPCHH